MARKKKTTFVPARTTAAGQNHAGFRQAASGIRSALGRIPRPISQTSFLNASDEDSVHGENGLDSDLADYLDNLQQQDKSGSDKEAAEGSDGRRRTGTPAMRHAFGRSRIDEQDDGDLDDLFHAHNAPAKGGSDDWGGASSGSEDEDSINGTPGDSSADEGSKSDDDDSGDDGSGTDGDDDAASDPGMAVDGEEPDKKHAAVRRRQIGARQDDVDSSDSEADALAVAGSSGRQQFPYAMRSRGEVTAAALAANPPRPKQKSVAKGAQGGKLLPGEKKKLRKEKIQAKRAAREAVRGFDVEAACEQLHTFVTVHNSEAMAPFPRHITPRMAFPPAGKHGLAVMSRLAALYGLRTTLIGKDKKRCVLAHFTDHTALPDEAVLRKAKKVAAAEIQRQRKGAEAGAGVGMHGMAHTPYDRSKQPTRSMLNGGDGSGSVTPRGRRRRSGGGGGSAVGGDFDAPRPFQQPVLFVASGMQEDRGDVQAVMVLPPVPRLAKADGHERLQGLSVGGERRLEHSSQHQQSAAAAAAAAAEAAMAAAVMSAEADEEDCESHHTGLGFQGLGFHRHSLTTASSDVVEPAATATIAAPAFAGFVSASHPAEEAATCVAPAAALALSCPPPPPPPPQRWLRASGSSSASASQTAAADASAAAAALDASQPVLVDRTPLVTDVKSVLPSDTAGGDLSGRPMTIPPGGSFPGPCDPSVKLISAPATGACGEHDGGEPEYLYKRAAFTLGLGLPPPQSLLHGTAHVAKADMGSSTSELVALPTHISSSRDMMLHQQPLSAQLGSSAVQTAPHMSHPARPLLAAQLLPPPPLPPGKRSSSLRKAMARLMSTPCAAASSRKVRCEGGHSIGARRHRMGSVSCRVVWGGRRSQAGPGSTGLRTSATSSRVQIHHMQADPASDNSDGSDDGSESDDNVVGNDSDFEPWNSPADHHAHGKSAITNSAVHAAADVQHQPATESGAAPVLQHQEERLAHKGWSKAQAKRLARAGQAHAVVVVCTSVDTFDPNRTAQQVKAATKKAAKLQRRQQRAEVERQERQQRNSRYNHGYGAQHAASEVLGVEVEAPWGRSGAVAAGFEIATVIAPAELSLGFGGFERFTNGIGSRLMAQMGWREGAGLGRAQQGRAEPLLAVHRPKGRGLGAE